MGWTVLLARPRRADRRAIRRYRAIRAQFDEAVALAPEAAVALYSLGSSEILDRATEEIVARLREWRLVGADIDVLDIGCGIGRIERALAPDVPRSPGSTCRRG